MASHVRSSDHGSRSWYSVALVGSSYLPIFVKLRVLRAFVLEVRTKTFLPQWCLYQPTPRMSFQAVVWWQRKHWSTFAARDYDAVTAVALKPRLSTAAISAAAEAF